MSRRAAGGGAARGGFPPLAGVRRLLVVKPSSFGDVLHALPAVAALKSGWPHLEVTWLVNSEWRPLLDGCPLLQAVLEFPRRRMRGAMAPFRFAAFLWRLRPLRPEVALDFQGLLRSALLARASRPGLLAGLSDAREGASLLHDRSVAVDGQAHAIERCMALVRAFGWSGPAPPVADLLPGGSAPAVDLPNRFLLLHPFSRGEGKSLTWTQVQRLVARLESLPVVVVGQPREDSRQALPPNALNLCGRTSLPELIWLSRRAGAVVSVDSGPMHLADALGRPLLGIHTWSDPRRVGPCRPGSRVWKGGRIMPPEEITSSLAAAASLPQDDDLDRIADEARRLAG